MAERKGTAANAAFKERVLLAAATCFRERGVAAVSIADIAERAGVAPIEIEAVFPSKSFLVCAAGADKLNTIIDEYIAAMPDATLADKIMYIVEQRCRWLREIREEAALFYRRALEGDQPWSDALDQLIWQLSVHFAALLEHEVRTGGLAPDTDVPTAVKTLVSIYLAGLVTIGLRADTFDVDRVLDFIGPQVRLFVGCLG